MPYRTIRELPTVVTSVLPREGQEIWMKAYNDAFGENDGAAAFAAWKKVKDAGYQNLPGHASWEKKSENSLIRTEKQEQWANCELSDIPGGKTGNGSLIPAKHHSVVCQRILDGRAAGGRRTYGENLRLSMQCDELCAEGFIAGAPRGISFWLDGPFAHELLRDLLAGDDE